MSVAQESHDARELFEMLIARDVVPCGWLETIDGFATRRFIDGDDKFYEVEYFYQSHLDLISQRNPEERSTFEKEWGSELESRRLSRTVHPLPHSLDLLISLASNPQGVRRAELLALEALKRFEPWRSAIPKAVLWQSIDASKSGMILGASLNRYYDLVRSDMAEVFSRQSDEEKLAQSRRMNRRIYEIFDLQQRTIASCNVFRSLFLSAFDWEEASLKGLSAGGNNFGDLPNPFDPLTGFDGLCSLGYALLDVSEFLIDGQRELCAVLGVPTVDSR